mgnify:CR=1 FL=1
MYATNTLPTPSRVGTRSIFPRGARTATEKAIRELWPTIVKKAGIGHLCPTLPKGALKLLGSSVKTGKGLKQGILTGIQYLLPAGWGDSPDLCPFSTPECASSCLGTESGHLGMDGGTARRGQVWKSALYLGNRALWRSLMDLELERLGRSARRQGLYAAVRFDGSSDTGAGERMTLNMATHGIMGYDYTKTVARAQRHNPQQEGNYSLALSFTGAPVNAAACREYLARGGRVAVVFDGPIPVGAEFLGAEIVDGDSTDAIFTQPPGTILGLTPKGAKAKAADCGGWKVSLDDPGIDWTYYIHHQIG